MTPEDEGSPVPTGIRGAFSWFAQWVAHGSVGHPMLDGIDYSDVLRDGSAMEQVFAVFGNVLRIGPDGEPINFREAERRAATCLYKYCKHGELPPGERPLEDWEYERFS